MVWASPARFPSCPTSVSRKPGKPDIEVSAGVVAEMRVALGSQGWVIRTVAPPTTRTASRPARRNARVRGMRSLRDTGDEASSTEGSALSMRVMTPVSSASSASPSSPVAPMSGRSRSRVGRAGTASGSSGLTDEPHLGQTSAPGGSRAPQPGHQAASLSEMRWVASMVSWQRGQVSEPSGTRPPQAGQITGRRPPLSRSASEARPGRTEGYHPSRGTRPPWECQRAQRTRS